MTCITSTIDEGFLWKPLRRTKMQVRNFVTLNQLLVCQSRNVFIYFSTKKLIFIDVGDVRIIKTLNNNDSDILNTTVIV